MFAFLGRHIIQKKYPEELSWFPLTPIFRPKSLPSPFTWLFFKFLLCCTKIQVLKNWSFSNCKYKAIGVVFGSLCLRVFWNEKVSTFEARDSTPYFANAVSAPLDGCTIWPGIGGESACSPSSRQYAAPTLWDSRAVPGSSCLCSLGTEGPAVQYYCRVW